MNRLFLKTVTTIVVGIFFTISCTDNQTKPDNGIDGVNGEGIYKLELSLPLFEAYNVLKNAETVVAEFIGEKDHKKHYITLMLESSSKRIKATSIENSLEDFPHQRYFFNHIFYSSSSISSDKVEANADELILSDNQSDIKSIGVGAIVSVEDPNDIFIVSTPNSLTQTYGSGNEDDPILIYSFNSFKTSIMESVARSSDTLACSGSYYQQSADIDFSSWYTDYDWAPIGDKNMNGNHVWFNGVYDGGYFGITSLYASSDGSMGLFYGLGNDAVVRNLSILGCNLRGGDYVGTIACKADFGSAIDQVYVEGIIYGNNYVGGFVGAYTESSTKSQSNSEYYAHNIQNSVFSGKVTIEAEENSNSDTQYGCGGFIGSCFNSAIDLYKVSFCGDVKDDDETNYVGIGGMIGMIKCDNDCSYNINISNTAFAGNINCDADYVGGVVGYVDGKYLNQFYDYCYLGYIWVKNSNDTSPSILGTNPITITSSMSVSSSGDYVGGVVGGSNSQAHMFDMVDNKYLTSVKGRDYVGILAGATDIYYELNAPTYSIDGFYYSKAEGRSNVGMVGRFSIVDKPILETVTISDFIFDSYCNITGSAQNSNESPSAIGGLFGSCYNVTVDYHNANIYGSIEGDGAQEMIGYSKNVTVLQK